MDYVIELLEREKKGMEVSLREQDLMHTNMRKASDYLKSISELKRAIKVLKTKVKMQS